MMKAAGSDRVVVARSEEGNHELVRRLALVGVSAKGVPTIRFAEPDDWTVVDGALRGLSSYDWVVFTSPRAVQACAGRMALLGIRAEGELPRFAAVGPSTANALRGVGLRVDFVPEAYLTSELGETIPDGLGARILLLRADIADRDLPRILARRGFEVKDLPVYSTKTVEGVINPATMAGAGVIVFASPSEVRALRERGGPEIFEHLTESAVAVCIGPVTASEARKAGFKRVTAPSESTLDSLVAQVKEVVEDA